MISLTGKILKEPMDDSIYWLIRSRKRYIMTSSMIHVISMNAQYKNTRQNMLKISLMCISTNIFNKMMILWIIRNNLLSLSNNVWYFHKNQANNYPIKECSVYFVLLKFSKFAKYTWAPNWNFAERCITAISISFKSFKKVLNCGHIQFSTAMMLRMC